MLNHRPMVASSLVLFLEFMLCLLCLKRSKAVWLLGALFHIPLTLTIAPAFGSVMAIGWGAGTLSSVVCRQRHSSLLVSMIALCYFLFMVH